jgi:hypothetical protein
MHHGKCGCEGCEVCDVLKGLPFPLSPFSARSDGDQMRRIMRHRQSPQSLICDCEMISPLFYEAHRKVNQMSASGSVNSISPHGKPCLLRELMVAWRCAGLGCVGKESRLRLASGNGKVSKQGQGVGIFPSPRLLS